MSDLAVLSTSREIPAGSVQSILSMSARAGAWTIGGRFLTQAGNLIRLFVLARLLAPGDFGLFAIALLTVNTLETFTEGGISTALIQRRGDISAHLNAAFTVNIMRGLVGAGAIVLAAPLVAAFFENDQATPIVRAVAIIFLLRSLVNPAVVYFSRSLEFRQLFMLTLAEVGIGMAVAVPLALLYRSVWALLLSLIAAQLARTVGSYLVTTIRPLPGVNLPELRSLINFGKWVTIANVLVFVLHNLDDLFVGKVLGTASLGLYQLTYRIANLPATDLSDVVAQVMLPAYSSLQRDGSGLRFAYLQVLQITGLLAIPAAAILAASAPDLFAGVLGNHWLPAVSAFQILSLFALIRAINGTLAPILQAMGRPSVLTWLSGIQLCVLAICIYPMTVTWGLVGAATAVTLANVIPLIAGGIKLAQLLDLDPRAFLNALWPGLRAGLVFCVALLATSSMLETTPATTLAIDAAVILAISPLVLLPLWRARQSIGGCHAVAG